MQESRTTPPNQQRCDVLVIGAGPAGSTVGALLARQGHAVTILEKDRHPRFHIGESLLPANLPLFDRLGVGEAIRAIGIRKNAAEFISPDHDHVQRFPFAEAWDKALSHAYQVRRADFDQILAKNAVESGAILVEGCRVRAVDFTQDAVDIQAKHDDGTTSHWHARFLIDASGRDTFMANRQHAKSRNPYHNSSALYGHFTGVERNPGDAEGNISIYWFDHGWFWVIPLADGATSVGAVTWPYYMKQRQGRTLSAFLLETITLCPPLAERLKHAELTNLVEATGNFSYATDHTYGDRYILLGDAYAFIDPVFSSGVMLAMQGAFFGAEAVDTCLRSPAQSRKALRRFDRGMRRGPREFSWFIYRMTSPTMRNLFMAPRNLLRIKEALLSLLSGDIYGKTPIWPSLYLFKLVYYLSALRDWRGTRAAARARRTQILPSEDGGTTAEA
ncbi:NAD(P)/FAD-dependent oxidoreductase [Thiorhodococcus mannitoliphagus]|uniref:NAD(P)/FAD-dependent oxidoreductase n=1 Tax=Thiorhodococcus mannitoliphagus TaxID=329406 RepID=A0A6P1DYF2_9GAMM|nr:NAD(P)/FAD-dependent oxidoreductase [Thiorhodococcus mannitoliphagus]NEX21746.1 NAD(P)/FAD-dependent oxidoreductase [Thiorhodococcus mannitoliphagus]